jgi:transposase-like protein
VDNLESAASSAGLGQQEQATCAANERGNNLLDTPTPLCDTLDMENPKTLADAIVHFEDADNSLNYLVKLRWPKGVECPYCATKEPMFLATRRIWKCRACRKQFSVKVGTIFNESPIALNKWLTAIWLVANCKNGVSSYEVARDLGVTQKTAWFMLHRIREAMQDKSTTQLSGEVEVDETFVGGHGKNMHKNKKPYKNRGGSVGKATVQGFLERKGRVRATVIGRPIPEIMREGVREYVAPESTLYSDAAWAYRNMRKEGFDHHFVDHAVAYVDGQIHTNGIENFWSLFKRGIHGTYVSVEPFHLFRYVDEQAFRFNERKLNDAERFAIVCQQVAGRRLTWNKLTGKDAVV